MGLSNFLGDQAGQAIGGKVGTAISNHYNPDHEQSGAGSLFNKVFGANQPDAPQAGAAAPVASAPLAPMPSQAQPDYSQTIAMNAQPKQGGGPLGFLANMFGIHV